MTRKQIDQMREIRLWVSQVVVPVVGFTTIVAKPELRDEFSQRINSTCEKVKNIFKK